MLRKARADGNAQQEAEILQAIKDGFKVPPKPPETSTAEFFKVNDRKLDALIKSTTDDLKKAETAVLRMSNDKYRKAIFNAQVYANTGAGTYEQAVDMACRDMLRAGLNCIEYKNGARHTLPDYARMAIRTANKRAYLRGEGEKRQEWGITTVVVNSRQGGCPKCAEYIGRVFIDDVYSGGKKSDGDYPLLSTAIQGGLFHPNCKDGTSTYYEGITTLKPVTEKEKEQMKQLDKAEQKKTNAENQAEKCGRIAKYSLDGDNKRIYSKRAQAWENKAKQKSEKLNTTVEKSAESGIMNLEHYVKGNFNVNFGKPYGEKPISKQLAETYSNEFNKVVDLFGNIDSISSVDVYAYKNNGIYGSYNDNSGILVVYGAGGKNVVSQLSKIAKAHKKTGQWSTSSYLHTYRHELGHALQKQFSISDNLYEDKLSKIEDLRQSLLKKFGDSTTDIAKLKANTLSIYGFDSLEDFIAESIAEYLNGKPRNTAKTVVTILKGG